LTENQAKQYVGRKSSFVSIKNIKSAKNMGEHYVFLEKHIKFAVKVNPKPLQTQKKRVCCKLAFQ